MRPELYQTRRASEESGKVAACWPRQLREPTLIGRIVANLRDSPRPHRTHAISASIDVRNALDNRLVPFQLGWVMRALLVQIG